MAFEYLSPSATLIYAEITDLARINPPVKSEGFSFSKKTRNGIAYWYMQHSMGSYRKQFLLGRESQGTLDLIKRKREVWENAKPDLRNIERLSSMAISGGCFAISNEAYKVFTLLEQAGLFTAGGVLTGHHAFQAYGNMLGVSWAIKTATQQDAVPARYNECTIAIPTTLHALKKQAHTSTPNMLLNGPLSKEHPSTTYLVRNKQFRVDIITSMTSDSQKAESPIHIAAFNTYAHGVQFLDFILEETIKTVLLYKTPILINIPQPARFAFHTLISSSQHTTQANADQSAKISYATNLLNLLLQDSPGHVWVALEAAKKYPSKKFRSSLVNAISKLPADIGEQLIKYWDELC
jgi:hypothetical protein